MKTFIVTSIYITYISATFLASRCLDHTLDAEVASESADLHEERLVAPTKKPYKPAAIKNAEEGKYFLLVCNLVVYLFVMLGVLFCLFFIYKKIFYDRNTEVELCRMRKELGQGMLEMAKFESINKSFLNGKDELPSNLFIEEGEDKEQAAEKYKSTLEKERLLTLHIIFLLLDPKRKDTNESMISIMKKHKLETKDQYNIWYEKQLHIIQQCPLPIYDQIANKYKNDYIFDRKEFKKFLLDILILNQMEYVKNLIPQSDRNVKTSQYR
jgi:hypothetical protein